ncbi:MAG: methionyl-tRNA formyltransferase [Kiritimatiellae bacterium]|nr:methionyl-tRNA formyltransferase [Kiritimatiellia bacterium]
MRIVFMGSSQASATCLRAILRLPGLQVVGVVTQPDRPAGRGRELTPCPCRAYAAERGISQCITPENVNAPEALAQIRAWKPDVVVVVAFGQFLREELLSLPPNGCINCHFSLLPKYRGASPVTAALLAGDEITGVSVIRMGVGMDDGPVILKAIEPIYSDDTGDTLMDKLAICGGVTLAKALKLMDAKKLPPEHEQEDDKATFAHKIRKTDGLIDWSKSSDHIERLLRAYTPWPGVYTFLPARFRKKGQTGRVVVTGAEFAKVAPEHRSELPGTVLECTKRGPVVRTGTTALLLTSLKPEGAREMDGRSFLAGRQLTPLVDMLLEN